jgi:4a-hydroxytetrahydrobiopterin dehydratase
MWDNINDKLIRKFSFKNFKDAFSFMTLIAELAEQMNHHPNWTNKYNIVEIELCTHDANNKLTEKDFELAKKIDLVYLKYSSI